jgi:hypothetical protein
MGRTAQQAVEAPGLPQHPSRNKGVQGNRANTCISMQHTHVSDSHASQIDPRRSVLSAPFMHMLNPIDEGGGNDFRIWDGYNRCYVRG